MDGIYKPRWNEERIKASALGCNDAQQMVFLKFSVPTYTITAFWQHGWCYGVEWKPLFRRTQKDDSNEKLIENGALSVIENVTFANDLERHRIQNHPSILYDAKLVDLAIASYI